MKRLISLLLSGAMYMFAATAASLLGILVVLWLKGYLTSERTYDVLAAAYGVTPQPPTETAKPEDPRIAYETVLERRALKGLDLDLRENALDKATSDLLNQKTKLNDDRTKYNLLLEQFEQRLAELQDGAASRAIQDVQQTILSMRPEQAKEQILKMLETEHEDEVVALLKMMPQDARKRLLSEFGTEEKDKLYQILDKILSGSGEGDLINAVRDQIDQFKNSQP